MSADPYTPGQAGQLSALAERGWQIRVRGRRDSLLLVDGIDNHGDAFLGHINATGILQGEPDDDARKPEVFGVGGQR